MLIEAVSTDAMNFRHYGWPIAITAAWAAESKRYVGCRLGDRA
jgi:hypothetical protein